MNIIHNNNELEEVFNTITSIFDEVNKMSTPNIDADTGAINFTPTASEKSSMQLRRDIKAIREDLDLLKKDIEDIKVLLLCLVSKDNFK